MQLQEVGLVIKSLPVFGSIRVFSAFWMSSSVKFIFIKSLYKIV